MIILWIDGHCYKAVTIEGWTTYYKNGFDISWSEGNAIFEAHLGGLR